MKYFKLFLCVFILSLVINVVEANAKIYGGKNSNYI